MSTEVSRFIVRRKDVVADDLIVENESLAIGSEMSTNDLLLNHPTVSRTHAGIAKIQGAFWIKNLSKSNGTIINGSLIETVQLQNEDTIQIGVFILRPTIEGDDLIIEVERQIDTVAASGRSTQLVGDPKVAIASGKTALLTPEAIKFLGQTGMLPNISTQPTGSATQFLGGMRLQRSMTGLLSSILSLPQSEQRRFQQTMDAFWERREKAKTGGEQKMEDGSILRPKEPDPEYKKFNLHLGKKKFNWIPTTDLVKPWPAGYLLTFGAFIILVGIAAAFIWQSAYSPGDISDPHQATEADKTKLASFITGADGKGILLAAKETVANRCAACHSAAGNVEQNCITCHKTEHFNPANAVDKHNKAGISCVDCHTEHKGRSFRPGTVSRTACFDCHRANPTHPKAKKVDDGSLLGIPHGGKLGYPIVNGEWTWTDPINIKISIPDSENLKPISKFHFVHLRGNRENTSRCMDCHTTFEKPKEIDKQKCAVCHGSDQYDAQGNPINIIEDTTKLATTAAKFKMDCNSCHTQHNESEQLIATLRPNGGRNRPIDPNQIYTVDSVYRGGKSWQWTSFAARFGGMSFTGWILFLSLVPLTVAGFVAFDSIRKRKVQDRIHGIEIELAKDRKHEAVDIKYASRWESETQKKAALTAAESNPVPQPYVNSETCIGCHACILACPQDVLGFDEQEHHAIVVNIEQCMEDTGCQQACPTVPQSCVLINTKKVIKEAPKPLRKGLNDGFETESVEGVYLVGDVSGVPLIRNAIKEGVVAVSKIAEKVKVEGRNPSVEYDVAIIGIGPGGISATARCAELGLSYVAIEQGRKYATIADKYPAGKYVAFNPFNPSDPSLGAVKLEGPGDLKEKMLGWWDEACNSLGLKINEYETCREVVKENNGYFSVKTEKNADGYKVSKVVLALGNAGEPRRLGVPGEVDGRVLYRLQDPSAFKKKNLVVVGAGNSAVEAAVDLTGKRQDDGTVIFPPPEEANEVSLVVRSDFPKDLTLENKMWIYYCMDQGRVKAYFGAGIKEIRDKEVVLSKIRDGQVIGTIPNDNVFALIGSIAPKEFLKKVGVKYAGEEKKDAKGGEAKPDAKSNGAKK